MFTVKLKSGKTINATSVVNTYRPLYDAQSEKPPVSGITIEDSETDLTLDEYTALFNEEGALETITVQQDGEDLDTFEGYTTIRDLSVQYLPSGSKYMQLFLEKPAV